MKAILTGHTRGLGAAIAQELLSRDIAVLGLARNRNAALRKQFPSIFREAEIDLADSAARPDERACRTRSGATTITGSAGSPWRLLAVTGPHF